MIIDLTRTFNEAVPGFKMHAVKTVAEHGWNAAELNIYSHAGTHMDAPWHFNASDTRIDELPVEKFVVKAHVVDVEPLTDSCLLTLDYFRSLHDIIKPGEAIIIKSGWHKRFGTDAFRNRMPRIAEETARWMAAAKIGMLAVEPQSVADVNNIEEVTLIHQILLGANVIIVEGICNTEALNSAMVQLIALPLKIYKGDGAPARVIAITD